MTSGDSNYDEGLCSAYMSEHLAGLFPTETPHRVVASAVEVHVEEAIDAGAAMSPLLSQAVTAFNESLRTQATALREVLAAVQQRAPAAVGALLENKRIRRVAELQQ
jgi:hypothetical protein